MSGDELFNGEPVITFERESSRRQFLRYAGLIGVGAAFVATGTAAIGGRASAAEPDFGNGDIGILNYALTLEYLEYNFYKMGLAKGLLTGRDLELVRPIEDHERQHVSAVSQAVSKLGGKPVDQPKINFPDKVFSSADQFLANAKTFEEVGVTAYHGQVPRIQSTAVLASAASIAGVESRHAAILESLTNGNPFPAPIEDHKPMSDVLPKVQPFLA